MKESPNATRLLLKAIAQGKRVTAADLGADKLEVRLAGYAPQDIRAVQRSATRPSHYNLEVLISRPDEDGKPKLMLLASAAPSADIDEDGVQFFHTGEAPAALGAMCWCVNAHNLDQGGWVDANSGARLQLVFKDGEARMLPRA